MSVELLTVLSSQHSPASNLPFVLGFLAAGFWVVGLYFWNVFNLFPIIEEPTAVLMTGVIFAVVFLAVVELMPSLKPSECLYTLRSADGVATTMARTKMVGDQCLTVGSKIVRIHYGEGLIQYFEESQALY